MDAEARFMAGLCQEALTIIAKAQCGLGVDTHEMAAAVAKQDAVAARREAELDPWVEMALRGVL